MAPHRLYAVPFACSFAVHLVLEQRGSSPEVAWVRRGPGRRIVDDGYALVNPKRKVPTLVLPTGEVLTEVVSILYTLDEPRLRDASDRRRSLEWLSFLATELHQQVLAPAYDPAASDATRQDVRERLLPTVLLPLEGELGRRETLAPADEPLGADAYLFWGLLLLRNLWPDAVATPGLLAFRSRYGRLPHALKVTTAERDALAAGR